ncbi:zinc-dependent alcohol dehydrogenase family protein [Bifidobacterium cuniculi]|uniref:Alcohol dehydrogenase n=1 Tax=Bifidobacterium cuniculi TaxID=1688 RepID=A0A087APQ2_9BIFI|nr:zinc-dependent alcohol dehydrogenase family protein [Bifidobacterium cuniculi]KFI60752.1 alcohol dehydrogenase [Bifidobacterium cuniculi]
MEQQTMKAAVFMEPGVMEVHEVARPVIEKPTDAIVRVLKACVCGSDLWWFRGINEREHGSLSGHEAIGVIDEVGTDVHDLKPGDFVIVPFTHNCGRCAACLKGFEADCFNAEPGGNAGYQAEYMRATFADSALVKVPGRPEDYSEEQLASLLTLSDVMATGYHAAVSAEVEEGDTVVVMGDGAVGLSGVLAAKMLGVKRIIAMSRHEDRQQLAREFGATDIVPERGDEAVARVMELTDGAGADAVLECVGSKQSIETALRVAGPGATVGRVGVPHDADIDTTALFWRNVGLKGGVASVAWHDRNALLAAVLDGTIDPGRVFTATFDLDHVQEAYEAMDQRKAIKSLIDIAKH